MKLPQLYPIPQHIRTTPLTALIPKVNQFLLKIDKYLDKPSAERKPEIILTLAAGIIRNLDSIYSKIRSDNCEEIKKWYFINSKKIGQILEIIKDIPECAACEQQLKDDLDQILRLIRDPHKNFLQSTKVIEESAKNYQTICTKITGAISLTATGASALSFLAGPLIGGAVTGSTAVVGGISTGAASIFSYRDGKRNAEEDALKAIYRDFGVNIGN